MSLLRKLAGETAIYGFSYILSRVLHYVLFTIYLTRVFNDDKSQFGIYRDLYFYVALVVVILTFRMETTYFRYAKENKPAVTTMSMTFLACLSGLFFTGLWLFRDDVARWMDYPAMTTHLMVLGGVLFFDVLCAVPFASLRQQNRPWLFLALKLGGIVLNIVFVLFFIEILPVLADMSLFWKNIMAWGDRLFFIFLGNLLASAIVFFGLIGFVKKEDFNWDTSFLKRMLVFSWPLVIVAIAGVINQSSYITFQKYILPHDLQTNLREGGVFAAAASLALLLNLFTIAFNYAAEPFFFAHRDREDARKVYADVALAFTIVGCVMMIVILGYIDLFQLLIGKNFRAGLEVVPLLLISYLLLGIYYNVSIWYKLADKTLWGAWIAGGGALITIVGNILLIKEMHVIGSAWAAVACYLFMVVLCYVLGQKLFPIPYKIWRMLGWILVSIAMYFLMEWLRGFYEDHIGIILMVNTMIIVLFLFLVFVFEKGLVRQVVRRSE